MTTSGAAKLDSPGHMSPEILQNKPRLCHGLLSIVLNYSVLHGMNIDAIEQDIPLTPVAGDPLCFSYLLFRKNWEGMLAVENQMGGPQQSFLASLVQQW